MKKPVPDQNLRYAVMFSNGQWFGNSIYRTQNLAEARLYSRLSTARGAVTSLGGDANIVVFKLAIVETLDDTDRRTAAQLRAQTRDAAKAKRKALKLLQDAQEQVERADNTLFRIRNSR